MADPEHLEILNQGVDVWNQWREERGEWTKVLPQTPGGHITLVNLSGADLRDANLEGVNLESANLTGASLSGANLRGADLSSALLSRANLGSVLLISGLSNEEYFRDKPIDDMDSPARLIVSPEALSSLNDLLSDLSSRAAYVPPTKHSGADLSGANLSMANLYDANLKRAKLIDANLKGAKLNLANLYDADLTHATLVETRFRYATLIGAVLAGADLTGADLTGANLSLTDLSGANLRRAKLELANLVYSNLEGADLSGAAVFGISAWELNLEQAVQSDLVITREGEPAITVDNLEIAQFISLLKHNEKIRTVIDTIGKKAVLILGRFTSERKAILDAVRDELRRRDYLPILFDFEKPASRDLTETVRTLAHLSRFIIADLTEPRSIPQELQAIVPDLAVPVQPLLLKGSSGEYGMFRDLKRKYHWVLATFEYTDQDDLLSSLGEKVIEAAEIKAQELQMR